VKREVRPALDSSSSLAAQARKYFTDSVQSVSGVFESYPAKIPKRIYWELASPVSLPIGRGVMVPISYSQPLFVKPDFAGDHFFNLDNLSQLLLYKDAFGQFHAEMLTWIPDSAFLRDPTQVFCGLLFVDDWRGNSLSRWLYSKGGVRKYHASNTQAATIIRTCNYVYGYNYSSGDPGGGYSWVQAGGCYYMYLPDRADYGDGGRPGLGGGASGGGGISGGTLAPVVFIGHNIIKDIRQYFQCFQNTSSASYQVTVCVDQPVPGSRTPWKLSLNSSSSGTNVVNVGHTFLVFTENIGGNIITRNVGFYPGVNVSPFTTSVAQGALNNDESHSYNISASFVVNSTMFFNMLAFVSQGNVSGYNYGLNTNNCTTFALNVLASGHIYLPSTVGYWYDGVGNDPGDLGEDIRNSNAPGIIKSTIFSPHLNMGTCN